MVPENNVLKCFLLLVMFIQFSDIYAQILSYNCPEGWVSYDNTCFLFVEDNPRIVEEAAADCWINGATLVAVKSYQTHRFISEWLLTNTLHSYSNWTTGGYFSNGIILWNDVEINNGAVYWNVPPPRDAIGHIKYSLSPATGEFGWTVSSSNFLDRYICESPASQVQEMKTLKRGIDYGLGIVDMSLIHHGPKILEEPRGVVIFGEPASTYIECIAHGNPNPRFQWKSGVTGNEAEITSSTNDRYTITGGRLSIENPITEDENNYRCVAENEIGKVLSQQAQVLFGFLKRFPNQPQSDSFAEAFKGTKLDCVAPSYHPVARYEWFKFTTHVFILPGHPYTFISNAGYLYFSDVQPTDEKKYYCVVTLAAPSDYTLANAQPTSRISLGQWLRVSPGNSEPYGPIIHTHAFPTPALRGRTIRLECIAYGRIPLTYSWRRENGIQFSAGTTISDRNRVLTIANAQLDAEGNYICQCNTNDASDTKVISVVMEALPYFPNPIKDMFVDPGQTVRWRCMAVARPKPQYQWYKDGVPIKTISGEIEIRRNYLFIKQVTYDRDPGMYQCAATNIHGTSFSSGQLKILSFRPNFNKHPLPVVTMAPLGGNITIPCKVEAAPIPEVQWLKGGGSLNLLPGNAGSRVSMTINNDLVITDVTHSDAGQYTCKASNINGDASNQTRLQVIEGITLIQSPAPTQVYVNTTAFLACQASFNSRQYDITYIWKFNGRVIDMKLSSHHVQGQRYNVEGLYVRDAQYTNVGLYECEARTTLHSVSRSAYLTVQGPPGAPAGVYVDDNSVTATSVRIIWTDGIQIDHGQPLLGYDVEGESHFHPGEWKIVAGDIPAPRTVTEAAASGLRPDQRTVTLEYLIPNTGYRFRVRAINSLGRGAEASMPSATVKLPATRPVLAPRNVTGGGGSVGTLAVVWEPLDVAEHSGPGIGYYVYWKKLGGSLRDWQKGTVEGNIGQFTATVGLDNYYLQYEVKVTAYNDFGDGPNSTTAIVFSAEGLPIATPILGDTDGYNGTAVIVNWTPVRDDRESMKGRVQGYDVNYFLNIHGFVPSENWEPDNAMTKRVMGQTDHAMIIGLEPNSEYYCSVMVFNSAGNGPKGEWRRAETNNFPPRQFPTHVGVKPMSEHSVKVHWRGVSTAPDEDSLMGYKIRVWEVQQDVRTAKDTIVEKTDTAIVGELQSRTVYVLRVLGYSAGGDGALSDMVYFTVLGGNVPFDPTTTEVCYSESDCNSAISQPSPSHLIIVITIMLFLIGYW